MKRQYFKSSVSRRSMMGSPLSAGSFVSRSSPAARAPAGSKRRKIERAAVAIMLLIAWAWIMVFFGMIFYHGYQYRTVRTEPDDEGEDDAVVSAVETDRIAIHKQTVEAVLLETDERPRPPPPPQKPKRKAPVMNITDFKLEPHQSPLIIFTCKRANYLRETLDDVLKYIPTDCSIGCPVIVSQDGNDAEVARVVTEFEQKFATQKNIPLKHLEHKSALRRGSNAADSYIALAKHYGWALRQVFDGKAVVSKTTTTTASMMPQRVLILEEDLHIAPDFFDYFRAMAPFLENDNSLLAVSAFNDNGFKDSVKDPQRVLRSDFFPGLGWMMTRKLWTNELQLNWAPEGYWDDWLRLPEQRKGRHILRPEISRTFHFGSKGGASNNQFGNSLVKVWLNPEAVSWKPDINNRQHWSHYLRALEIYDRQYYNLVQASKLTTSVADALEQSKDSDVRLEYRGMQQFRKLAKQLKIMEDEKVGIPRTAYKGVVETRPHGDHFLFLTPPLEQLNTEFGDAALSPSTGEKRRR